MTMCIMETKQEVITVKIQDDGIPFIINTWMLNDVLQYFRIE